MDSSLKAQPQCKSSGSSGRVRCHVGCVTLTPMQSCKPVEDSTMFKTNYASRTYDNDFFVISYLSVSRSPSNDSPMDKLMRCKDDIFEILADNDRAQWK